MLTAKILALMKLRNWYFTITRWRITFVQKPPFCHIRAVTRQKWYGTQAGSRVGDILVLCERKKILNAPIFRDIYALALTEELSCCTRSYITYCDTLYWGSSGTDSPAPGSGEVVGGGKFWLSLLKKRRRILFGWKLKVHFISEALTWRTTV